MKYLNFLKDYQGLSLETIKKDKTIRGAIERYLFLVCQSAIDYAEALVSFLKLRSPITYADVFEILAEEELISSDMSLKMKKMVGFRNILTQAYGEINIEIVDQILKKDNKDIFHFIKQMDKIF